MSEVELKKGEVVIFTSDYQVFGYNAKDKEGMFYKETGEDKYLVYLPDTKEWCEPRASILRRKKPGFAPIRFVRFCKNIRLLEYTYEE